MKKSVIRTEMGLKRGGRMQISYHGAGRYSIQVFRGGKLREDCDIPAEVISKART
jgi:hypothetical protein